MADLTSRYSRTDHGRRAIPFGIGVSARRVEHQRNSRFFAYLGYSRTFVATQRPKKKINFFLKSESSRLGESLVWVAGSVSNYQLNFAATSCVIIFFPKHFHTVNHLDTWPCQWPGRGRKHTDTNGALGLCKSTAHTCCSNQYQSSSSSLHPIKFHGKHNFSPFENSNFFK